MFVVLGANGRAGGETARALIELRKPVRVVLRRPEQADRWTKLGAEVAIASIEDVPGLAAALRGVGKGETRAKKPLTADCVTALRTVITGAESRVQAVTQAQQ